MLQVPIDAARVAAVLDMNLQTKAFAYAQTVDRAAVKKKAPEMLETFETLHKGKKGALDLGELRSKYVDVAKATLSALDGKVPTEAELAALPPLVRAAVDAAERSAIYHSRYVRALTDAFPDGVVDLDFVFKRNLGFVGMQAAEKLILDLDLGPAVEKLVNKHKGKKPITVGGLELSVQASPKHEGKPIQGLSGDGPYLVLSDGQRTVMATYEKSFERLEIRSVGPGESYASPGTGYEKTSVFERFAGKIPGRAKSEEKSTAEKTVDRFQYGYADLTSLEVLARAVDQVGGGKKQSLIDEVIRGAVRAENQVLGELTVRDGWVSKYREIAKLIRKHGEQSIGDMDHTIAIGKQMERTRYDENDEEKTEVLLKAQGPLLLFYEHAGSVSHSVRLDALKEGRLDLFVAEDRAPGQRVEFDAQGKVTTPDERHPYFYSVAFDVNLVLDSLKEELK